MDTSEFFNQDFMSDVTIICGDRTVKCHKLILCTKSEYFKKAIGPDSKFVESKRKELTLQDDEPAAVEALLRYVYTFKYEEETDLHSWKTWPLHFEVYKVARKYLMPELAEKALRKMRKLTAKLDDVEEVAEVVLAIHEEVDGDMLDLGKDLTEKHLAVLMRHPRYRAYLEADITLMWKCFDQLDFAKNLVEVQYVRCGCSARFYRVKGTEFSTPTCYSYGKRKRCGADLGLQPLRSLWAKREADGSIYLPESFQLMAGKSAIRGASYPRSWKSAHEGLVIEVARTMGSTRSDHG